MPDVDETNALPRAPASVTLLVNTVPMSLAAIPERAVPLGMLALKGGSRAILSLRPAFFLDTEDELCIPLGDEHANALHRIVVSVTAARPTLAIGCLQGPDGADARETERALTRNLHDMRPKCLMLALVGGWFELPLQPPHKREAEVPSHHRSAFRKREALRLAAESLLLGALDATSESPRPLARRRNVAGGTLFGQGALAQAS